MAINEVNIDGRLGRAPELRFTNGGKAVANASLAQDIQRRKDDGTWESIRTDWYNLLAWEKKAELLAMLPQGTLVQVKGRLQTSTWEGEDGKKNYKTEIVVSDIAIPFISEKTVEIEGNDIIFKRKGKREAPVENGFERPASTNTYDYDEEPF